MKTLKQCLDVQLATRAGLGQEIRENVRALMRTVPPHCRTVLSALIAEPVVNFLEDSSNRYDPRFIHDEMLVSTVVLNRVVVCLSVDEFPDGRTPLLLSVHDILHDPFYDLGRRAHDAVFVAQLQHLAF